MAGEKKSNTSLIVTVVALVAAVVVAVVGFVGKGNVSNELNTLKEKVGSMFTADDVAAAKEGLLDADAVQAKVDEA
ncbi:MAG: hypothetical protein MJ142_04165, partial [Clostridia bacterium]|nr:hypothetical protein [Clostridia bacterium]